MPAELDDWMHSSPKRSDDWVISTFDVRTTRGLPSLPPGRYVITLQLQRIAEIDGSDK